MASGMLQSAEVSFGIRDSERRKEHMSPDNDPTHIFDTDGLNPFGPYTRQEEKMIEFNETKVPGRELYTEQIAPDGTRQVSISHQILCQGCGEVYVMLGVTGSSIRGIVLCQTCAHRRFLLRLFKPFWSPFVKIDGE